MSKMICTSCGHIHNDGQPPTRCPSCGAPGDKYQGLGEPLPLTLEEVRGRARDKLKNICAVYPFCDGDKDRICQKENYGRAIGMGGAGMGRSFKANIEALEKIRLNTRLVGEHFTPDLRLDFFGQTLSMPIMGASTSGMSQYNNAIGEKDFCTATLQGCLDAGSLSWRGDTFFYTWENHPGLDALEELGGRGVPIFKPRSQEALKRLIERAERIGCPAVGVDLDGCGSTNFARTNQPVFRKSIKDLRELVASTGLPFIAKGIMTVEDAEACAEAGAKAVVVSNHGGRVLDSTPGTAEVLPSIAQSVGGRVFVLADGGIRNGYDVLKMLGLGARAVLIGRDLIRAAIGGGAEGVKLHMKHLQKVLANAMLMTGCPNLSQADRRIIYG